jgi:hypothetical protein
MTAATRKWRSEASEQWLHEVLCFASSSVVADCFVLRNRQLLKPPKRHAAAVYSYKADPLNGAMLTPLIAKSQLYSGAC